ncbi:MAG: efflux RND transporter periplasmic adaptor subunit [Janthinobacterium lividum]
MQTAIWRNGMALLVMAAVVGGTVWTVRHEHTPGQLDVLTAQVMDMSAMRPPAGAAPVALASVRRGSLADTVTYTGTVLALNAQDISPRITGTLVALPVYPGDTVKKGQLVARLDTAEVGAKTDQAVRVAREAQSAATVARLNHQLHHQAALDQASALVQASQQQIADSQADAQAALAGISDADAAVQSASAQTAYWNTEIVREKQLADAGAASQQEYQNEQSQASAASAALRSAQAKARGARAASQAANAKVRLAQRQADAASAGERMAQADIAVAEGQAAQAQAGAEAAQAGVREADVIEGYARITAPSDGVVTARPVAPGTLVQPGTVILRLAEIDKVRVQAQVAASDLSGIAVGSPVQIALPDGSQIPAHVTALFPQASDETRTAVVEAVIPNPGHRLLPGAFAAMQIAKRPSASKLMVPTSAILSEGGAASVWLASGTAGAAIQVVYRCEKCGMHYSAADAKHNHFIDPMDGGRLVPISQSTPAPNSGAVGLRVRLVAVKAGASDGDWTEVTTQSLQPGDQVVTQGQAGLTEGAAIVPVAWSANGPVSLPTAASANHGQTLYKCEKCGMTYSEADAKRSNYIDPMDGGKLIPVEGR